MLRLMQRGMVVSLLVALCAVTAVGQGGIVAGAGTAAIDGIKSQGEWDTAGTLSFSANLPSTLGGGTTPAVVYVMNDTANLYVAVEFLSSVRDTGYLSTYYDRDSDGLREDNDTALRIDLSSQGWNVFDDYWAEANTSWTQDPEGEGEAAYQNNGTVSFYELSHPLDTTDDVHDLSLSAGSQVGFRLILDIEHNGESYPSFVPGPGLGEFMPLTVAQASTQNAAPSPGPAVPPASQNGCLTEIEPNNSLADLTEATSITGDLCFEGRLEEADRDLYRLTTSIARTIVIDTDIPLNGDTLLRLYDASGLEIGFNDDTFGSKESYLRVCLEPGDYAVEVSAYTADLSFAYRLNVSIDISCAARDAWMYDEEPNNGIPTAQYVGELPTPMAVAGAVSPSDVDYFAFKVSAPADVTIETVLPAGGDSVLTLLDELGNLVAENDDALGRESLLKATLNPGMYYAIVRSYAPDEAFEYVLRIGGSATSVADVPQQPSTGQNAPSTTAVGPRALQAWVPFEVNGQTLDIPGISPSVCVTDWDGDGDLDLLVGNYSLHPDNGNPYALYYQNRGTAAQPVLAEGIPFAYSSGTAAFGFDIRPNAIDWDGDDVLDLIIGSTDGVFIFLNTGSVGSVNLGNRANALPAGHTPENKTWLAPHLADWNEDGLLDLLISTPGSDNQSFVYLFMNAGTDPLQFSTTGTEVYAGNALIREGSSNTPFVVDWDNDGLQDLLLKRGTLFYWCQNIGIVGAPALKSPMPLLLESGAPLVLGKGGVSGQYWVVDWNADGILDIVTGNYEGEVGVFLGVGAAP